MEERECWQAMDVNPSVDNRLHVSSKGSSKNLQSGIVFVLVEVVTR